MEKDRNNYAVLRIRINLNIPEQARLYEMMNDMYSSSFERNKAIVGLLIDRYVNNVISFHPDTASPTASALGVGEAQMEDTIKIILEKIEKLEKSVLESGKDNKDTELRKCITGWSRYGNCICCGLNGVQCCNQCNEDCNIRCGWIDDPYIPAQELPAEQNTDTNKMPDITQDTQNLVDDVRTETIEPVNTVNIEPVESSDAGVTAAPEDNFTIDEDIINYLSSL
jgi:hypothetical protein